MNDKNTPLAPNAIPVDVAAMEICPGSIIKLVSPTGAITSYEIVPNALLNVETGQRGISPEFYDFRLDQAGRVSLLEGGPIGCKG